MLTRKLLPLLFKGFGCSGGCHYWIANKNKCRVLWGSILCLWSFISWVIIVLTRLGWSLDRVEENNEGEVHTEEERLGGNNQWVGTQSPWWRTLRTIVGRGCKSMRTKWTTTSCFCRKPNTSLYQRATTISPSPFLGSFSPFLSGEWFPNQ